MTSVFHHIIFVFLFWDFCLWSPSSTRPIHMTKRFLPSTIPPEDYEETLLWSVKLVMDSVHHSDDIHLTGKKIAQALHLLFLGQIGELSGYYLFAYPIAEELPLDGTDVSSNISLGRLHELHHHMHGEMFAEIKQTVEDGLDGHPRVKWYSREIVRPRHKRELSFHDKAFSKQWHLKNDRSPFMDIDVMKVWETGVTGHGVVVAVVDDGLERTNPDLKNNYSPKGSWDFNGNDADPSPSSSSAGNHHGTRCAGEIAAVPNSVCAVGVAFGAKVSGIRCLDGPLTDSLEASAFNKNMQVNDIYSCSWGPDDNGKTVDGPHHLAQLAMRHGINNGRGGYGSIYVVASGNGGQYRDNCNYDGYANSIYTVTIGAVDENGNMPYYAEQCSALMAVTFSSGGEKTRNIVTTDWRKITGTGCTESHTGTSAAAPIAAGMIALMLNVQRCLTWRDIQYLIILTAVKVDRNAVWSQNAAGLFHSHKHGFGLLSAWRLTNAAKVWKMVPWLTAYNTEVINVNMKIPEGGPLVLTHEISEEDVSGFEIHIMEHVLVAVNITHPARGSLDIRLVCPSGTQSHVGPPRPEDSSNSGFKGWWFSTVRCWGENPVGKWKLTVQDTVADTWQGFITHWQLQVFGTPMSEKEFRERKWAVENAINTSYITLKNETPFCHPPPQMAKNVTPLSRKMLKILSLVSSMLLLVAFYEIVEYAFCYNEEKQQHKQALCRLQREQAGSGSAPEESIRLLQNEDIPMDVLSFSDMQQVQENSTVDRNAIVQYALDSFAPEELEPNYNCKNSKHPLSGSKNQMVSGFQTTELLANLPKCHESLCHVKESSSVCDSFTSGEDFDDLQKVNR